MTILYRGLLVFCSLTFFFILFSGKKYVIEKKRAFNYTAQLVLIAVVLHLGSNSGLDKVPNETLLLLIATIFCSIFILMALPSPSELMNSEVKNNE